MKCVIWLLRLLACCLASPVALPAAHYTNSTSLQLQASLTRPEIVAGDTVWLRAGNYSPPHTNAGSLGAPQWTVSLSGASNNLITFRAYPGERPILDRQWRFGNSKYLRFRDLEFFDSFKGQNPTNANYPNGPWAHFDGAGNGNSSQFEWINCYIHDVNNCWSGGASGHLIQGCIIIYVGMTALEHVCYTAGDRFIGNIVGFAAQDAMNYNSPDVPFLAQSNIFFGSCQAVTSPSGQDMRIATSGGHAADISYNCFYNRRFDNIPYGAIRSEGGTVWIRSNFFATAQAAYFRGVAEGAFVGNTTWQNSTGWPGPSLYRATTNGTWSIDYNRYATIGPNEPRIDNLSARYTFTTWTNTFAEFDAHSTSTSAAPADITFVIPNHDEPKRAHIAVYNFSSNTTVNVNLSGVLSDGDTYQLYSAQDFAAGAIQTGIYTGTPISVTMTGLTVTPVIYGTNWGMHTPAATSPEFAAFILKGRSVSGLTIPSNLHVVPSAAEAPPARRSPADP